MMVSDWNEMNGGASGGVSADDRGARLGGSLSGTNLARAGDYNQRIVLQVIRRKPDITRAEIAVITGLTAPTIANITGRLFEAGLIIDSGRRVGQRGQPATRLQINPDGCFAIGLNIDRDHVTIVSLDLAGTVRSRFTQQIAFAAPEDVREVVAQELAAIRRRGIIPRDRMLGMGVAIPDDLAQVALPHRPESYATWSDIDVAELLEDVVPWSIHVDNDAAAAAIGEAQFGSGLETSNFFYLLISAGLGGGVVVDGAYMRGASARSGEIGFLSIDPRDPSGPAVQDTVSLSALADRLETAGMAIGLDDPTVALPDGSAAVVDAWLEDAAATLAIPLLHVNAALNPGAILIGGRLPEALLDRLATAAERRVADLRGRLPALAPIRRATLSRDAPALGAAILPFLDRILPSDAILMKLG